MKMMQSLTLSYRLQEAEVVLHNLRVHVEQCNEIAPKYVSEKADYVRCILAGILEDAEEALNG